ncbi:MAG TPA: iron ABC transporter permease [Acetobacteraceae bacterium]|nr:iron ABC transporter permease [Acetobacteraceae bacterium]
MRIAGEARPFRGGVVVLLTIVVMLPVALIVYQSLLDQAFFDPAAQLGLGAFDFIFTDPGFWQALLTTIIFAIGLVGVATPLGAAIAFLFTRTDLMGRRWLEPLVLVPMFVSSVVLAFGYTVAVGPTGFVSLWVKGLIGVVPWNIYGLGGMVVIGGLSHVPYVYLYLSSAMRNLPSDLEEAARTAGAPVWRVAIDVTLPLVLPALVFSVALCALLSFESFGLPLVLGDPSGVEVLTTYIYKLTALLGTPSYQLMAAVCVVLLVITLPLVWVQRRLLARGRRFAALGGKGARAKPLPLGKAGQAVALIAVLLWLFVSVVLPVGGIALRAFVRNWGQGVNLIDQLTTTNFVHLVEVEALLRGIINTVLLGVVGGAIAVGVYLLIALAGHRWSSRSGARLLDYLVLLPRALPGLVVGLAFFWVFLFVPFLRPIRTTLLSMLIAYMVVGLSYGLRLIQAALLQVAPELEESARATGATIGQTWTGILVPIIRPGLVGAWVLIMIIFLREYSTGVYLMSAGTEVVGSLIVLLLASGEIDTIAALALISVVLTLGGLAVALRVGASVHD